jgi:manganese efflux pump family protein
MTIYSIIALAVALAMDAFAVSIATGAYLQSIRPRQVFRLSWHFGLFQAMMPVIGWYSGTVVHDYIEAFDHWIAFGLLFFIGSNMIRGAFSDHDEESDKKDPTKGLSLVMLSVATSIDAFAAGLSLSVLRVSIVLPAFVIGITAAGFTILGLYLGSRSATILFLKKYTEFFGGIILYGIGIHILYQHGAMGM